MTFEIVEFVEGMVFDITFDFRQELAFDCWVRVVDGKNFPFFNEIYLPLFGFSHESTTFIGFLPSHMLCFVQVF